MRAILVFPLFIGLACAQFGDFGGFDNVADRFQQGVSDFVNRVQSIPLSNDVQNFADFVSQTGKTYANEAEQNVREGVFAARKSIVDSGNAAFSAGRSTYKLAINSFSDLTNAEFLKKLTGNKKSARGNQKSGRLRKSSKVSAGASIPDAFDWREKGGVTPIKFQGDCGSCWSFAVNGAIEGHIFRKTGQLPSLSEQHLIDCGTEDYGLLGCDGGFQEYGFTLVKEQNGVAKSEKYPYLDRKDTCKYNPSLKGAEIKGFAVIEPNDENKMKEVVATLGPLACSIYGIETLLLYKEGIYADEECNKGEVNHAVVIVGYGSENGHDYWIVKNSWDKAWGEDGYFRLPRGKNFCSIASECSYPIV